MSQSDTCRKIRVYCVEDEDRDFEEYHIGLLLAMQSLNCIPSEYRSVQKSLEENTVISRDDSAFQVLWFKCAGQEVSNFVPVKVFLDQELKPDLLILDLAIRGETDTHVNAGSDFLKTRHDLGDYEWLCLSLHATTQDGYHDGIDEFIRSQGLDYQSKVLGKTYADARKIQQLSKCLRRIADRYLQRASRIEQLKVVGLIDSLDWQNHIVKLSKEQWRLKDLLVGYYCPETAEYDLEVFKRKWGLDVTLAASECFGIHAVKAITHAIPRDYYPEDQIADELKRQKMALDESLKMVLETQNLVTWSDAVISYKQNVDDFFKSIAEQQDIREKKRNGFRYGSRSNKEPPERTMIELIKEPNEMTFGRQAFEIYFPAHEIFREPLVNCLNDCGTEKLFYLHSSKLDAGIYPFTPAGVKINLVHCYGNYIVMPQTVPYQEQDLLAGTSDVITALRNHLFHLFGRYYVLRRDNNNWQAYECVAGKEVVTLGDISKISIGEELREHIVSDTAHQTYHLFEFLSWRQ